MSWFLLLCGLCHPANQHGLSSGIASVLVGGSFSLHPSPALGIFALGSWGIGVILSLLLGVVSLLIFILSIVALVKAYHYQVYEMIGIGRLTRFFLSKVS